MATLGTLNRLHRAQHDLEIARTDLRNAAALIGRLEEQRLRLNAELGEARLSTSTAIDRAARAQHAADRARAATDKAQTEIERLRQRPRDLEKLVRRAFERRGVDPMGHELGVFAAGLAVVSAFREGQPVDAAIAWLEHELAGEVA